MDNTTTLRIYNNTNYDIGVTLSSTQQRVIRAGSFLPYVAIEDILFIEDNSRCKPFSSKIFSIKDSNNKEYSLEDLGGATDPYVEKMFSPDEIMANLNKSAKHIASWIADINDPVQLDAIAAMAGQMDLQGSKLKVIQAKIPNQNLLDTEE